MNNELNGDNGQQLQNKSAKLFEQMIQLGTQPGWHIRHVQDSAGRQVLFFAEHECGLQTNTLGVGYAALKQFDQDLQDEFSKCIDEELVLTKKMADIVKAFIERKSKAKLIVQ